jgi:hypothetical protein
MRTGIIGVPMETKRKPETAAEIEDRKSKME